MAEGEAADRAARAMRAGAPRGALSPAPRGAKVDQRHGRCSQFGRFEQWAGPAAGDGPRSPFRPVLLTLGWSRYGNEPTFDLWGQISPYQTLRIH